MLPIVSLFVLVLACSLDGLGVGITYGLRKIKIPFLSVAIISLCSGSIVYLSMQIGVWLAQFFHPSTAKVIGAVILICIGMWALIQSTAQGHRNSDDAVESEASIESEELSAGRKKTIVEIELKRFGLVIRILKQPSAADIDRSGNISASEAAVLGLALSLDAFGAGIGAALLGFSPLTTAVFIALGSGSFIAIGLRIGFVFCGSAWVQKFAFVPGTILIAMGILKLL